MADLIFYTNPQSRGRIVRWMIEEVGQPYGTEIIQYDQLKNERYLAVNPMGELMMATPAIAPNAIILRTQHQLVAVSESAAPPSR